MSSMYVDQLDDGYEAMEGMWVVRDREQPIYAQSSPAGRSLVFPIVAGPYATKVEAEAALAEYKYA